MLFWDDGSRRREVYDLWQRNFQDPVPYADFYFDQYYGRNRVLLHEDGECGQINGSVHLNPYRLHVRGKTFEGSYLVGIATDEAYRRQGIMRHMLLETFAKLREEGAPFTYLMPADENYYLPFDFRFGMSQTEQEMMCLPAEEKLRFCFRDHLDREELQEAVRLEQEEKEKTFAVFTEVDEPYLARLEKEAASDYGRMLYVFESGSGSDDGDGGEDRDTYIGRFCVSAEYDTLFINRIFCRKAFRRDFLKDILRWHEDLYHYGNYQVVLDESWDDLIMPAGPAGHVRLLVPHRKKKIMFRILDLERLGSFLTAAPAPESPGEDPEESRGHLYVEDAILSVQEGYYTISFPGEGKVLIQKESGLPGREYEEGTGDKRSCDWGRIGIGALTSLLFGGLSAGDREEEKLSGLTDAGRDGLGRLQTLCPVCIMEIV